MDVAPAGKSPFILKRFLKKIAIALGIYKSPHGKEVSKTFFVDIYLTPDSFKNVKLEFFGTITAATLVCFVNDKSITLKVRDRTAVAPSSYFYAYENLISVGLETGITGVKAYPILDNTAIQPEDILTRRYFIHWDGNQQEPGFTDHSMRVIDEVNDPVIQCVLQAKITDSNSPFRDLYYPAFDLNARSYRLPSWTWTNGVLVRLFTEAARLRNDPRLGEKATQLADRLLAFQELDGDEQGAIMARWDILNQTPQGITPQLATNDSAFIASYGFLSAYDYSGDEKYLVAAQKVGDWIVNRGMKSDGQLYMGKRLDTGGWVKNHLFVDSGFTSTLFAGLYRITSEEKWKVATTRFENWYIDHLYDPVNHYFWWNWYDFRSPAKTMFARGQAWALDGVLATYNITSNEKYLAVLRAVANTLINYQSTEGAWYYHLNNPKTGLDAKGTPIIAYHLARIWQITKSEKIKQSVEAALAWCQSATITRKDDYRTHGGIAAHSEEGTMYGARNVATIFMYAQAYYKLTTYTLEDESYEFNQ